MSIYRKLNLFLLVIIVMFSAVACTDNDVNTIEKSSTTNTTFNENTTKNSDDKVDKNIINVTSIIESLYDLSNVQTLASQSDYIALVTIDKILGVSNVNKLNGEFISQAYTFGNASVIKNIKGNLDSKQINFTRIGGKLPYEQWIKGEDDSQKAEELNTQSFKINIVNYKVHGDIDVEQGKSYLVFMNHNPDFNEKNEYTIHGYQYGLREIQGLQQDVKVKDNTSNKWEDLSKITKLF